MGILNQCIIDFPFSLEGQNEVEALTSALNDTWRVVINDFKNGMKMKNAERIHFDPLIQSKSAIQEILINQKKMFFGQSLQASTSRLLHQTLDDESLSKNYRFSIITLLLEETKNTCCAIIENTYNSN